MSKSDKYLNDLIKHTNKWMNICKEIRKLNDQQYLTLKNNQSLFGEQ